MELQSATNDERPKSINGNQEMALTGKDDSSIQRTSSVLELGKTTESTDENGALQGWRLQVTVLGLCVGLFLATLEISIVSTALVNITDGLRMFGQGNWIVTAYLLTYTGCMMIWAQFSDVLGRKLFIGLAACTFMIFSGACGGSQNSAEILTFRTLQGVGGGGLYSMSMVVLPEIAGPKKFPKYTAIVSATFALSFLLGPLIGGGINNHTTWRWVFYLNIPGGFVAFALIMIAMPNGFPNHRRSGQVAHGQGKKPAKSLWRLDFIGAVLLLATFVLFTFALQEAGTNYAWNSGIIIAFLVVTGACWIAFLAWERFITDRKGRQEPVLTWRFIRSRVFVGLSITAFFTGGPFTAAIIQIPQRVQTVNNASPLGAGVRLIPFTVASPVASIIAAGVIGKFKVRPMYALLVGSVIQLVGAICFTTLPVSTEFKASQYGFQVILGFGLGINSAVLAMATPLVVEKRDISAAMGAVTQFRILGGAIGLAIATNVLNSSVRPALASILNQGQLGAILQSTAAIDVLSPALQEQVRSAFARGYNLQFKALIGLICAEFPATLLMWEKNPRAPGT